MTMAPVVATPPVPRGRPRSAAADRAIADATLALLAEHGWAGLTMNGVAHQAGVSTATLYRRYSCKEDLVCAAVTARYEEREPIDTGSLAGDLRAKLTELVERIGGDGGRVIEGIIGEAVRNPALARILRTTAFAHGREDLRGLIERAVERGEIAPPEDIGVVVSLLAGPLFYRLLITGESLTPRVVDKLLPLLLAALGARP